MCFHLKSVEFPEGLREIPYQTFKCCDSLEEIIIPSTVESIGDWAFEFCLRQLKNVHVLGRETRIATSAFYLLEDVTLNIYGHSISLKEWLRLYDNIK
jgi:hypothetical protein